MHCPSHGLGMSNAASLLTFGPHNPDLVFTSKRTSRKVGLSPRTKG